MHGESGKTSSDSSSSCFCSVTGRKNDDDIGRTSRDHSERPRTHRVRQRIVRGPASQPPPRDSQPTAPPVRQRDAEAPESLRDTALSVGTLSNGLRYYLRANSMPSHRVELRLA